MTKAANRKQGSGASTSSTRPAPTFRGRDVVFVDPLDEKESYWWPAMIVPVPEIDSSMDCTVLNPGECLVKYFEDNKYSVVPFTDLQPFVPTTIPFLEFELAAGQKFLRNGGVINAMAYLESGKVKRKFSWNRWGMAQDQGLSLDTHKNYTITLPLVSDEAFAGQQPHAGSSSTISSPATSTAHYTDNETELRDTDLKEESLTSTSPIQDEDQPLTDAHTTSSNNININTATTQSSRAHPRRPSAIATTSAGTGNTTAISLSSSSSSSPLPRASSPANMAGTLLPSPVSLRDLGSTEPIDENELNGRRSKSKSEGTATKDSHVKSRSRRGSREADSSSKGVKDKDIVRENKDTKDEDGSAKAIKKDSPRRAKSATVQDHSSTLPSSSTSSAPPTPLSIASLPPTPVSVESKKRKAASDSNAPESSSALASDSGSTSARSSRQGSAEVSAGPHSGSSPRSTRHSARTTRAVDGHAEDAGSDAPASSEVTIKKGNASASPAQDSPIRLMTQRMTRQRSTQKSEGFTNGKAEQKSTSDGVASSSEKDTAESQSMPMEVDSDFIKSRAVSEKSTLALALEIDADGVKHEREASSSIPPSSLASSSSASSTCSPSSTTAEEGGVLTLEQERRAMSFSFEHVLPGLTVGSKEREAFYENCMDHLQKLRKEHRRLKQILQASETKSRRATRSSPGRNGYTSAHYQQQQQQHPSANGTSSSSSRTSAVAAALTAVTTASSNASPQSNTADQSNAQPVVQHIPYTPPVPSQATPPAMLSTANITTTTRRSAATAAAAAVSATMNRSSRQSAAEKQEANSKKRAAASGNDGSREVMTRAKRRLR